MLRKECSRYLRFSYLADFLVLDSLMNIYISSVKTLDVKLNEHLHPELFESETHD